MKDSFNQNIIRAQSRELKNNIALACLRLISEPKDYLVSKITMDWEEICDTIQISILSVVSLKLLNPRQVTESAKA